MNTLLTAEPATPPYTHLAARILEIGDPCRAAVLRVQALGMRNAAGDEMYALLLALLDGVDSGGAIWIGDGVPARAIKFLQLGSILPAKRLPDGDERDVAVDWQQAISRPLLQAA